MHTNVVDLFVTNRVVLDKFETNFVQAYRTNMKVLHLTNWTMVLAFKTNWVTRPVTNLVEIDLPSESAAPVATPATSAAIAAKNTSSAEVLSLKASRNAKLTANNLFEVQIKASWPQTPEAPVQVQQWRIEREDGQILCFGQDTEFRRALPAGTHRVLLKAQRDAQGSVDGGHGHLDRYPTRGFARATACP